MVGIYLVLPSRQTNLAGVVTIIRSINGFIPHDLNQYIVYHN